MNLVENVVLGAGVLIAVFALITLFRFIVAYINAPEDRSRSPLELATDTTSRWLSGVFVAILGTASLGLVNFFDVVAMFTEFIGMHPFAASNVAILGLGAALNEGLTSLTTTQYVGIAFGIIGLTFAATVVYGE